MNLHRTDQSPDWAAVAPSARNGWQRVAARTEGVITLANAISTLGLGLVIAGAFAITTRHYEIGIVYTIAGRLCDLADGFAADKTGTKSPLGEVVDASFDKAAIFASLISTWLAGLVWWPAFAIIALQNSFNIVAGVAARDKGRIHPSIAGKLTTTFQWSGLVSLVIAFFVPQFAFVGYGCVAIGIALGIGTSWQYARAAFK